jgi:hypothetical protein
MYGFANIISLLNKSFKHIRVQNKWLSFCKLKIALLLFLPAIFAGYSFGTTYYSYQSGDWSVTSTWTTDASGTLWENASIPGNSDNVIILNGRTVSVSSNSKTVNSLQINLGGYLDLTTTSGHNFGTVTGQGQLKLASSNFPAGTFTSFVAAGGGTVEYYNLNNTAISITQLTYNNLIVSNYTSNINTVYLNNATNPITYNVNGNFSLNNNSSGSLTFYFGNPTASDNLINMSVYGNFTVNAGCNIRVNNFASSHTIPNPSSYTLSAYPVHTLNLFGNFTNNGSVRFTGLPSPVINNYYTLAGTAYSGVNYGDVQVFFQGAANNTVTCNGTTDFFRFIEAKGTDQTYTLEVISSGAGNFALYGPDNQGNNNAGGGSVGDYGYGVYYKALFINYGTLKLDANINIPSISEGGEDFNLLPTASLWVNGAIVSSTVAGFNGTGYQAATLYGYLHISAGSFSTGDAAGIVLMEYGTPSILVEGTGLLDVSQSWSATGATNIISYTQTGGTTNIRLKGEDHGGAMFGLSSTSSVFTMSGGTLNFTCDSFIDNTTDFQLMNIQTQAGNYQVTGGTLNLSLPEAATAYTAISTVPFYNVNIVNKSGTGTTTVQWSAPGPLNVPGNLSIGALTVLDLNANTISLNVGQNFTIASGGTYHPGNNTTTFNGSGGQVFTINGNITNGLDNLVLSNTSNTNLTSNITVLGSLTINSNCFLNDQGNSISVAGNISNSGIHTSQAGGSIILNGAGAQSIGGSGNGQFGNLSVNNTAGPVSFTSNQTVNGNLRLANGILSINQYNLSLDSSTNVYDGLTGTTAAFSNTKMITTNGLQSDGGLSKTYSKSYHSFIFPIGSGGAYHPATISFSSAPATWGSVNVKPVGELHPMATSANALKYYWKVTSTGITGIQANTVSQLYHFINPADINAGALTSYIPGVYNPGNWTVINDFSQVDKINYNVKFTNVSYLTGDYTAGQIDAMGTVKVYYSRQTGPWNNVNTWSSISNSGPVDGTLPGSDNPVVIGDGISNNHTVTIPAGDNGITVGSLQINSGSALDITTTTGHNFGVIPNQSVSGAGTLRISSSAATAIFPGGDFKNFLNTGGGTVEYYNTTATGITAFTLPASYLANGSAVNITGYNNLNINPGAGTGQTIIMPNTALTIYGNLTANGTGLAEFNTQATTQTVTVSGNVNVLSGTLEFTNGNNTAQNIVVNGNITVNSGADFIVANAGTATNTMTILGNLLNNGTFNMYPAAGRLCNVTFTGNASNTISGTGAVTSFNILTVNKGSSLSPVLNVTSSAFSLNASLAAALNLINGTFMLTSPLSITLTTTSEFIVPPSACLAANGGTFNIVSGATTEPLELQGTLQVLNGTVNIGNSIGGTTYNHDIEYASAGTPQIIVSGGTLNVDGQIRRNLNNTMGSLIYTQTGGTVLVRGLTDNTTRGIFEITNTGSQFNMSGGTLTIERASTSATPGFADAYLVPASNNVTGGTLQFGDGNTPSGQQLFFRLNAATPLGSIIVDGNTNPKSVNLNINALTLLNNLTINGSASVFACNGLNVNISGSLTNNNTTGTIGLANGGFQPGSSVQVTAFNGTSPVTIAGVSGNITNFANLLMSSASTVSLNSNTNVAVNGLLTLSSGTLADGGNIISVFGNIVNNAAHTSSGGNGIVLSGSQLQTISGNTGNGVFGNLNINNTNGVNLLDNTTVNGILTLTGGIFYINDYTLTLGINTSVVTPSSFSSTLMIALNGVVSDEGIVKMFPGGIPATFTYPFGVAGKYTPASYTITSSNAGSLKVVPVNGADPAETDAPGDELEYYWKVTASGFSGLTNATQKYSYLTSDVTGTESLYTGAQFNNGVWTNFGTTSVNTSSTPHSINISGDFLTGEYTAGQPANFGTLHTLYSLKSGNWNDGTVWAQDLPSNPACGCFPQGNPVIIQAGNTITMTANSAVAYSVNIAASAVLDFQATTFHSLGLISGSGKMRLQSTNSGMFVFPGGDYDSFMETSNSIVEFYGTVNATLPLKPGNIYKPYQNVIFTNSGVKYISADNLKILSNLTLNNAATLNNTLYNMTVDISGNWVDNNTASSGFVPGTGRVNFSGNSAQQINIINNITENFYDFCISNPAGLSFTSAGNTGSVIVADNLYLTSGNIFTSTINKLTISNTSPLAAIGGGTGSFVDGPLYKEINSGSNFTFPVGNGTRYGYISLSSVNTSATYVSQYIDNQSAFDITKMLAPITWVSNNENWWISSSVTSQGYITLRWDASSFDPSFNRTLLQVVEWNPGGSPNPQWEPQGAFIDDGGTSSGTVETSAAINLSPLANEHYCTIGSEGKPTATILSPAYSTSICNNATSTATIQVKLTGTAPWSLSYTVNGVLTTLTNQASSPVNIVINSASAGINNIAGTYNFLLTGITDKNGINGNVDNHIVNLTVYAVPTPSVTGFATVGTSQNNVAYSTTLVTGDSYSWTVTGGNIASGQNTNAITVNWGTTAGTGIITVNETNTNNCSVTNTLDVNIVNSPTPDVSGNTNVCAGVSGIIYQTPYVSTHTYSWTITGGTITSPVTGTVAGGFDQITVTWGTSPETGTVTVKEIYGSTVSNTLNVNINLLPLTTPAVANNSTCSGTGVTLTITGAEGASDYYLYNGATQVTTVHTTTGGNYAFPVFIPAVTTTYTVKVVNQYGCSEFLTSEPAVTVYPVSATGPLYRKPNE